MNVGRLLKQSHRQQFAVSRAQREAMDRVLLEWEFPHARMPIDGEIMPIDGEIWRSVHTHQLRVSRPTALVWRKPYSRAVMGELRISFRTDPVTRDQEVEVDAAAATTGRNVGHIQVLLENQMDQTIPYRLKWYPAGFDEYLVGPLTVRRPVRERTW